MENECLKWSKAEESWGWQSDELWKEEVEVEIKNDDETKRKPMITHMIHSDHLILASDQNPGIYIIVIWELVRELKVGDINNRQSYFKAFISINQWKCFKVNFVN